VIVPDSEKCNKCGSPMLQKHRRFDKYVRVPWSCQSCSATNGSSTVRDWGGSEGADGTERHSVEVIAVLREVPRDDSMRTLVFWKLAFSHLLGTSTTNRLFRPLMPKHYGVFLAACGF
jgi:hypothetical protein